MLTILFLSLCLLLFLPLPLSVSSAPPELNPLEHEVLPLRHSTPTAAPAVPQSPTEWQRGTFQVVRPLPLSFSMKADNTVTIYRARVDRKDVILRVLKGEGLACEVTCK